MRNTHLKCLFVLLPMFFCLPLTTLAVDTDDYRGADATTAERSLKHNPFQRAFQKRTLKANGYPSLSEVSASSDLLLKAILFDDQLPLVNVNGKILALGEQFGGYTLKEVSREAAVFYKQGIMTRLELLENTESQQLLVGDDSY